MEYRFEYRQTYYWWEWGFLFLLVGGIPIIVSFPLAFFVAKDMNSVLVLIICSGLLLSLISYLIWKAMKLHKIKIDDTGLLYSQNQRQKRQMRIDEIQRISIQYTESMDCGIHRFEIRFEVRNGEPLKVAEEKIFSTNFKKFQEFSKFLRVFGGANHIELLEDIALLKK